MKNKRQELFTAHIRSNHVQYNQLRIKNQRLLANEHLRCLAILYSDRFYAGTKNIDDYKHYTIHDISREIKLRTIMKRIENDRVIHKKKEEKKAQQQKFLDQMKRMNK